MEHHETTRPDDGDPFDRLYGSDRGTNGAHGGYEEGPPPPRGARPDLTAIFVMLDAVRTGLPDGMSDRFTSLVREILLTLRSLIDWYLERLDRGARKPQVEDIPLD